MKGLRVFFLVLVHSGAGCAAGPSKADEGIESAQRRQFSAGQAEVGRNATVGSSSKSDLTLVLPEPIEFTVHELSELVSRMELPSDLESVPAWKVAILDTLGQRMRDSGRQSVPLSEEMTGAEYLLATLYLARGHWLREPSAIAALPLFLASNCIEADDVRAVYALTAIAHDAGLDDGGVAKTVALFYLKRAKGIGRVEAMACFLPGATAIEIADLIESSPDVTTLTDAEWLGTQGWRSNIDFSKLDLKTCARLSESDARAISDRAAVAGVYEDAVHGFSIKFPPYWLQKPGRSSESIVKASDPGTSQGIAFFVVAAVPRPTDLSRHAFVPIDVLVALNELSPGVRFRVLDSGRCQVAMRNAQWALGAISSPFGELSSLQYALIDGERLFWLYGVTDRGGESLEKALEAFREVAESFTCN